MTERLLTIKDNSLKQKIVQILSDEETLTAKQLHSKLQRQFSINNSYQATHKMLQNMTTDRILEKKKEGYSLKEEWIEEVQKNTEQLVQKIRKKEPKIDDMKEGESRNFTFDGILDLGWFLIDKVGKAPNPEKTLLLCLWRFCYSVVGLGEQHITSLKESMKNTQWQI